MTRTIKATDLKNITLNEKDTELSVLQNVMVILNTFRGEVPMQRDFGLSSETMHRPLNVAKTLLIADITEAIEKNEPRAKVKSVTFDTDTTRTDKLIPIVEVEING